MTNKDLERMQVAFIKQRLKLQYLQRADNCSSHNLLFYPPKIENTITSLVHNKW